MSFVFHQKKKGVMMMIKLKRVTHRLLTNEARGKRMKVKSSWKQINSISKIIQLTLNTPGCTKVYIYVYPESIVQHTQKKREMNTERDNWHLLLAIRIKYYLRWQVVIVVWTTCHSISFTLEIWDIVSSGFSSGGFMFALFS